MKEPKGLDENRDTELKEIKAISDRLRLTETDPGYDSYWDALLLWLNS